MTWWIFDTDHITLLQQSHALIRERVRLVDPAMLAITIITAEEQCRGWLDVIRRYTNTPHQVWAYQGFQAAIHFTRHVTILPFDATAIAHYDQLRQLKLRIGSQDLRIAAIALSLGATVITRNTRDFGQIPGLSIEDWTIA